MTVIIMQFSPNSHSFPSSDFYSVIHKYLREFRPLLYSSRDSHAEGEHVNRERDNQVSVLPVARCAECHAFCIAFCTACNTHASGRNLITGLTSAASPTVDISRTCKVGQKLGVSLPMLTCSPSAWPSRLQYRRGRNSRRDLRIILYLFSSARCSRTLSFHIIPLMWQSFTQQVKYKRG